ncbi:MAG: hypothetical protein M5U05_18655 [Anaerolineales bacterium]|nr:hypothetical protein [Anaerolineales bacterium]
MAKTESLETLFEQAIAAIPYNLEPTGMTMGEIELDEAGNVVYAEEFRFKVGQLFDMDLIAGGWVELRREDGEILICAFMCIACDGDWENGRILPDDSTYQGVYDLEAQSWNFWIDRFWSD